MIEGLIGPPTLPGAGRSRVTRRRLQTNSRSMRAPNGQVRRVQALLQIIVGVFLVLFGYWIGADHARLVLFGERTTGKLVASSSKRDDRSPVGTHVCHCSVTVGLRNSRAYAAFGTRAALRAGAGARICADSERNGEECRERFEHTPIAPTNRSGARRASA